VLILRQLQLHGIDADPAMVDRLKALDDQKISTAPAPRRRTTPQQNNALNGIQIATGAVSRVLNPVQALGSTLVPAAQAQTAPPPPQARDMSMFYADPGPKPKATQVAMAPPPPRAKPKPATSQSGSMTGLATYYTGSGGSDGVVGAMTANNRDRFNPNAMTVAVQKSLRGKYLNKWLVVEDVGTGKSVRVFANDVGSMGGTDKSINRQDPRIVDLSPAAFKQLYGSLSRGVGRIRVRIDSNQQGQSPSRVR
jgi:rare lipoprotein A (peptidoglycan hydrolase)